MNTENQYTVKQLAQLSGISVRTLHHYDKRGLLKPRTRTKSGYRLYSTSELMLLQQILFYKELDFSLKEIAHLLHDPEFDVLTALENHKIALTAKQKKIDVLRQTIDKTILKLKGITSMNDNELYEGLSEETAVAYRKDAIEKYGEAAITRAEQTIGRLDKKDFSGLLSAHESIREKLRTMMHLPCESEEVQKGITDHYQIIRQLWGTSDLADRQAEAYKGLGKLYLSDERFTAKNAIPDPDFAAFISKAMDYYANNFLV